MLNIIKIVGILIFVVIFIGVAYKITVNITNNIKNQVVSDVTKNQTESSTKDIVKQLTGEGSAKNANIHQKEIAGHPFELAYLDTTQYQTTGNKDIKFSDNGWYAPSYSMPRSKLLDVNLNQKIKLKVIGNFEGYLENMSTVNKDCGENINWYGAKCLTTEAYHFSEFATYLIDEDGNKRALRILGTRQNIIRGNSRERYNFSDLTVENIGEEIVITDNTGFKISYSKDFKYVTTDGGREENRGSNYGELNLNQKWMLGINCHVNGEGYCKLEIKDIQTN